MKKSSKLLLLDDDFEAFDVIGICSGMNDYRIAWNLNKAFSWQLEHSDRVLQIPQKKSKEVISFSYYQQLGFEEYTDLYLVKNKQFSRPLLEDYPQLDYILIIKNNLVFENKNESVKVSPEGIIL